MEKRKVVVRVVCLLLAIAVVVTTFLSMILGFL